MKQKSFKTRFAPSPTGMLHLGNVRTALFNYLAAQHAEGVFLLRLEDTDAVRSIKSSVEALEEDLRWLGLDWTEGPHIGGPNAPYVQSARGDIYQKYFGQFESKGLAYACFCSEQELAVARKTQLAAGMPPRYSGRCRSVSVEETRARLARGMPATLRFRVEDGRTVDFDDKVRGHQEFKTDDIGDFVIRRSDGTPAFFFCNALDDALMGVTLVVRGEDHLANTPRQLLLLKALGLAAPDYAHIALVVGADGAPLSKRSGSHGVRDLRESGFLPLAINNYLARLGHTYESNALMSLEELARNFSIDRSSKAPARYDEAQLRHWQQEALHRMETEALWVWMGPEVHALVPANWKADFVDTVRANVTFPIDAIHWARVLFTEEVPLSAAARATLDRVGKDFFERALNAVDSLPADLSGFSQTVQKATGASGKKLYQPLRAALTGELDGPELARLLPLMTYKRMRERLRRASER
jgi:glutamyl-tRNA synthetase